MDRGDTFFLGALTGVFIMSIATGMINARNENAPPAPWTVEERKCSRVMIKEIRARVNTPQPIALESLLADCRYFINKHNKEQ